MSRIDPALLLIWARVARCGNLQAAAEELCLTQPAVSHRLKQLQEWMGEPLYRRTRRGVTPTPTGMHLLRLAEQIEATLDEAEAVRGDMRGLLRGSLSLIASHSNAESILPRVIVAFRARYPGISVRLVTTNSRQAKATRDQADLVFVEDEAVFSGSGDWLQQALVETEIVLLVPEGHPWAVSARPVSLTDLGSETLIWREEGSGIREHVLQALQSQGIYPDIRYELSGLAAIRDAVRCGLGISFVSELASAGQPAGLRTLPTVPPILHTLSVLYRQGASQSATAFLELLGAVSENGKNHI